MINNNHHISLLLGYIQIATFLPVFILQHYDITYIIVFYVFKICALYVYCGTVLFKQILNYIYSPVSNVFTTTLLLQLTVFSTIMEITASLEYTVICMVLMYIMQLVWFIFYPILDYTSRTAYRNMWITCTVCSIVCSVAMLYSHSPFDVEHACFRMTISLIMALVTWFLFYGIGYFCTIVPE